MNKSKETKTCTTCGEEIGADEGYCGRYRDGSPSPESHFNMNNWKEEFTNKFKMAMSYTDDELKAFISKVEQDAYKRGINNTMEKLSALDYKLFNSLWHYKELWGSDCPRDELPSLIVYRTEDIKKLTNTTNKDNE